MTRAQSTARLTRTMGRLTDEQLAALASLAVTLAISDLIGSEDDATREAIAEGVAQAKRGEFVRAGEPPHDRADYRSQQQRPAANRDEGSLPDSS